MTPAACLGAVLACFLCGPIASAGAAVVSVTAPTTSAATVAPSATVALTGASVSDSAGNSDQVLVTVSTGSGDVSFTATSGLTLATGYNSFTGVNTVAFQGTLTNVNAALASMTYTAPAQTTSDSVSITATSLADAGGNSIAYDPATGHFYEYVADLDVTWFQAQTGANSMTFDGDQGYLATIPNAAVSSFVEQHLPASNVWAGGESFDYPSGYNGNSSIQRVWVWADGANQFPADTSFTPDTGYYGGPLAGQIFTECANVAGSCTFTNQSAWNGAGNDAASWIESTWNNGEPNNSDSYGWNSNNLSLGPLNGEHYQELNTGGTNHWNDLSPYQSSNGANVQGYVVEFGNNWGTASTFPEGQGTGSAAITVAVAAAAPTAIAVNPISTVGGQAAVSWSAPTSNGGSAITGYQVTASPGNETCTTATTGCTVTGLTDGTSYTFSVEAINAVGDSTADTSSSMTVIGAPFAPSGINAVGISATGGQVTLSWTAPFNGGSAITGYQVTASPGNETCSTGTTSCTLTGLTDGVSYTLSVRAINAAGDSTAATSSSVTVVGPPSAPTGLTAVGTSTDGGQVTLSWTAPFNGGSAITGYQVTASPGSETCSTGTTSCTLTGLTDGVSYTLSVRAINAAGDSTAATSSSVMVIGAPVAPTGLSGSGVSANGGQVTLSWKAPADRGSPITRYTVTASPGGASCTTTSTSCTIAGLTDGDAYSFVVTATNAAGTSMPSSPLTVTPSSPASNTQVASSNLSVSTSKLYVSPIGNVTVGLTCSGGVTTCEASGSVQIPAASLSAHREGMVNAASFDGLEVSPETTTSTTIQLPPTILRELQAAGVRTVQATVSVDTGSTTTTDTVSIAVPAGLDVCPSTVGSISGNTLGLVHLGESIATIDSRYLKHERQRFGFDRFCLSTRGAFRVETADAKLARASHMSMKDLRGKVVLALTANRRYKLDGIRAGERLSQAEKTHTLSTGIVSGLNTWYVIQGATANGILKVHDGKIAEVGIANRKLTATTADQLAFFRQATLR